MKKIFFNIFVIFFLGSCGFTPIYIQEKNINYDVQIEKVEGDRLINNIIISQLNRSSNEKSANKIKININTEYKKTINSKNVTGAASSFELVSKTLINITKNDKTHDMIVTKKFIMDKNDNSVDQNNYERTVKENFASSIIEQLRFKLTSLE